MSASTTVPGPIITYPAGTELHFWAAEDTECHPCIPNEWKVQKKDSWLDKQIKRKGWR